MGPFRLAPIVVFMVSWELDNFDGPDAQVYGAVIDAETEELIQQEIGTSS